MKSIRDNGTINTMFDNCKPIVLDDKVKLIMENVEPKHVESNDRLQDGLNALNNFKLSKSEMQDNFKKIFEEQKQKPLHYKPKIDKKSYRKQSTTKNTIAKESNDMNMENYIMINGTKIELTEDQIKQISDIASTCASEYKNEDESPFNDRPKINDEVYCITSDGVRCITDDDYNAKMITVANSFNNEAFADQIYLHEVLNRKLMKYAYDNGARDCAWSGDNLHYYIYFDVLDCNFHVNAHQCRRSQLAYFSNPKIAGQAIEDIVKPFMKLNPDFVW